MGEHLQTSSDGDYDIDVSSDGVTYRELSNGASAGSSDNDSKGDFDEESEHDDGEEDVEEGDFSYYNEQGAEYYKRYEDNEYYVDDDDAAGGEEEEEEEESEEEEEEDEEEGEEEVDAEEAEEENLIEYLTDGDPDSPDSNEQLTDSDHEMLFEPSSAAREVVNSGVGETNAPGVAVAQPMSDVELLLTNCKPSAAAFAQLCTPPREQTSSAAESNVDTDCSM